MPPSPSLKPVISVAAVISALALNIPVPAFAQYQVLEISPGHEAGSAEPVPVPAEEPYRFTITASADGLVLAGDVPAAAFQQFVAVRAGTPLTDETAIRTGAPDGFAIDALAALEAARLLADGRTGLDSEGWFIDGELSPGATPDDILSILAAATTPPERWTIAVTEAPAPADDTIPDAVEDEEAPTSPHVIPGPVPGIQDDAPTIPEPAVTPALDPGNESRDDTEDEETSTSLDVIPGLVPGIQNDAAAPPEPANTSEPDYTFQAVKDAEGATILRGNIPSTLLETLRSIDGISITIDRIIATPRVPEDYARAATRGLRALALLETGQVVLRDGTWLLSGNAATDAVGNAAVALLDAGGAETEWKTLLRAPRAVDVCREQVALYMADKAILFPSAGTAPTAASLDVLPGLVERLAICPEAEIYVEGHTDADGSADANLTLSIRRAEAVVDALVDLGVAPSRLYAVGYGASLPVAPNTTAEGKRQNRRIVFSFEDIASPAQ